MFVSCFSYSPTMPVLFVSKSGAFLQTSLASYKMFLGMLLCTRCWLYWILRYPCVDYNTFGMVCLSLTEG